MKGIKYRVVSDHFCGRTHTDEIEHRRATHDVDDDDDDDGYTNKYYISDINNRKKNYSGNSPHPHPQKDTDIVLCLIANVFSATPLHDKR